MFNDNGKNRIWPAYLIIALVCLIADLMKQPERIVSQTVEVEIRSVD